MTRGQRKHYLFCVSNRGYAASLVRRRVYRPLADAAASREGFVRVVDESGEDYLYPRRLFVEIDLPPEAERAFRAPR
jgi:hypothetical protein